MNDYVVKKSVYENLVTEVNTIDTKIPTTSGLVSKITHDSDKQGHKKD